MKVFSAAKVVFFILHICGSLSELCNSKFQIKNRCMSTYGSVINTFSNVASVSGCSNLCSQDRRCKSVLFDKTSKTCQTNSETTSNFPTGCASVVKYAEVITNSCRKSLGMSCTSSSQCITTHSTCFHGVCDCIAGYSNRTTDDMCVDLHGCSSYGSTFQAATGYLLSGYNDRTISGSSIAACKAACVVETDCICLTAEFDLSRATCYLSVDTALTQPKAYTSSATYNIYQRDCA